MIGSALIRGGFKDLKGFFFLLLLSSLFFFFFLFTREDCIETASGRFEVVPLFRSRPRVCLRGIFFKCLDELF